MHVIEAQRVASSLGVTIEDLEEHYWTVSLHPCFEIFEREPHRTKVGGELPEVGKFMPTSKNGGPPIVKQQHNSMNSTTSGGQAFGQGGGIKGL